MVKRYLNSSMTQYANASISTPWSAATTAFIRVVGQDRSGRSRKRATDRRATVSARTRAVSRAARRPAAGSRRTPGDPEAMRELYKTLRRKPGMRPRRPRKGGLLRQIRPGASPAKTAGGCEIAPVAVKLSCVWSSDDKVQLKARPGAADSRGSAESPMRSLNDCRPRFEPWPSLFLVPCACSPDVSDAWLPPGPGGRHAGGDPPTPRRSAPRARPRSERAKRASRSTCARSEGAAGAKREQEKRTSRPKPRRAAPGGGARPTFAAETAGEPEKGRRSAAKQHRQPCRASCRAWRAHDGPSSPPARRGPDGRSYLDLIESGR